MGIIKLPHTAGTSLSANNGTASGYELPIRSNLNCPKIAKFRLCQYSLQHISTVTYLWQHVIASPFLKQKQNSGFKKYNRPIKSDNIFLKHINFQLHYLTNLVTICYLLSVINVNQRRATHKQPHIIH